MKSSAGLVMERFAVISCAIFGDRLSAENLKSPVTLRRPGNEQNDVGEGSLVAAVRYFGMFGWADTHDCPADRIQLNKEDRLPHFGS